MYYTLYFTEELYPGTIGDSVLEAFNLIEKMYLNQYRGKDNSKEVYDWSLKFHERMFDSVSRIEEARKNIGQEDKRYNKIREELKSSD